MSEHISGVYSRGLNAPYESRAEGGGQPGNRGYRTRNINSFSVAEGNGSFSRRGFNRARNEGVGQGSHNHMKTNDAVHAFGLPRLFQLLTLPNDQVITALDRSLHNFKQNLKAESSSDEMMIVLIQVIGEKICGETSLQEIQNGLVALAAEVHFLGKLKDFTLKLAFGSSRSSSASTSVKFNEIQIDRSHSRILNALSAFYGLLCVRMTAFAADKLVPSIQAAVNANLIFRGNKLLDEETSLELETRLMKLLEDLESSKKVEEKPEERRRRFRQRDELSAAQLEQLYLINPEDDFWELEIIPKSEEIIAEEDPFLRPNLVRGKYPSAKTYLDVQFRLLREDFMAPLRESVKEFLSHEAEYSQRKKRLPPGTIRFYHDVKLKKVECLLETTLYSMQFSTANLKRVKWDKSKRLLNGSLLLLTPDKFKTIYFATVGRRDEKQLLKGIIDVMWEGNVRPETFVNVSFLMIECEVYFESYRHTLKALQDMARPAPPLYDKPRLETFKMTKYIVYMTSEPIQAPQYLANLPATEKLHMDFKMLLKQNAPALQLIQAVSEELRKLSELSNEEDSEGSLADLKESLITNPPVLVPFFGNPLDPQQWPTASELGMDEPQYEAFKSAITQEISIIQGPPGTGKTYIGLQIMKLLLANPRVTWSFPPEYLHQNIHDVDSDEEFSKADPGELLRRQLQEINEHRSLYESPIFVVCYTNHALDQFLQGIISIMHSLSMDPSGKLVRVGGRSKVEEIQQYNIREVNRYYTRNHVFDQDYAQLRNRTRESLFRLQNERADYKSLFRDLSHPEGIISFYDLWTSYPGIHQIGSVLPRELKEVFLSSSSNKLINWLGLSADEFNSENFQLGDVIRKWFRIFQQKPYWKHAVADREIEPGEENEEELEDEEFRSMVQGHRLEEEVIIKEDEKKLYKAAKLKYLFHWNFHGDFQSAKDKIYEDYESANEIGDIWMMKKAENDLWQLQLAERKYNNQCSFLQEILAAYGEERMELPEVTEDLLARAHEQTPPLRPTLNEKWAVYFWFVEELKKAFLKEVMKMEEEINKAQEKMVQVNNRGDGIILQKAKVVGMTTTGAAKYNTLLRMMKSRIVIVEEAAEVLESHIVTSITEHCEQLILIGDHKQLRPPTTVHNLAKNYNLDLSLFERLINNNLKWNHLKAQHRMRPEICKLLVPTIYKDLEDHPNVLKYASVPGFTKNLFFVTHTQAEKADNDSMTKSNEYEAEYLVKLCRYLMLQGFKASQVTVLTTYIGQMFCIKRLMAQEGDTCRGVRVTVVDNFQGEENDIILLSLVRSNEENRIGFLKTDNRICVALSRAKQGFFIIGNMDCLVNSQSKTWKKIYQELQAQGSFGDALKLTCQIHGDSVDIKSPEDFQRMSPEGGCTKMCPGVLPNCNHACQRVCHILDRDHKEYQCKLPCQRLCPDPAKHHCVGPCYEDPCPPCEVPMIRQLPCGHAVTFPCYVDYRHWDCVEIVPKTLKCGHVVPAECHVFEDSCVCTSLVDRKLECGHVKTLPCHVPTEGYECTEFVDKELACGHTGWMKCVEDPAKFMCNVTCHKKLPCGHEQGVLCSADVDVVRCQTVLRMKKPDCLHDVDVPCTLSHEPAKWPCVSMCDTRLECGHQCTKPCHLQDDPEHLTYRCKKNCARNCANDLHPCTKNHPCHKPCDPCSVRTEKSLPCGHVIKEDCSFDISSWTCKKPCERQVDCPKGHGCLKKCWEECVPCIAETEKKSIDCGHLLKVKCGEVAQRSVCEELVPAAVKSPCGHAVEVPCRIQHTCTSKDVLKYCKQPCGNIVPTNEGGCGHPCKGDCGSCYQGRIHVKCEEKCGRILACGHVCKFPCASLCPPCEDQCILRCRHSACKKKCGEPCSGCNERCKWSCEHLKCTRKCGELCNREPCNEPCMKKLKCEHDCIGSCGEPCPPQCRICNQEEVQEILFGEEDKEDARFVYLEDCKHVIYRESMDTWMKTEQYYREIGVKQCPKCKTTITKSVRYGNILKEKLNGVLAVRKKVFGNSELQKKAQEMAANKLQFSRDHKFEFVRDALEKLVFRIEREPTKRGMKIVRHLTKVDQYTFESLDNFVYWWEQAESDVKQKPVPASAVLPPTRRFETFLGRTVEVPRRQQQPVVKQDLTAECAEDLVQRYNRLFAILLARSLPLSYQEKKDFDREFERLHDLYRLGLRRGIHYFEKFDGAIIMFDSVRDYLTDHRPYDSGRKKEVENLLKDLELLVKAGWDLEINKKKAESRANRELIFSAMGFAGNHWYRCDQGHLYVVAGCGALNQAGVCPECRTRIGGGSGHVAVRDEQVIRQQIASVVDMFPQLTAPDFSLAERTNRNAVAGSGNIFYRQGYGGRPGGRGRNRGQ